MGLEGEGEEGAGCEEDGGQQFVASQEGCVGRAIFFSDFYEEDYADKVEYRGHEQLADAAGVGHPKTEKCSYDR